MCAKDVWRNASANAGARREYMIEPSCVGIGHPVLVYIDRSCVTRLTFSWSLVNLSSLLDGGRAPSNKIADLWCVVVSDDRLNIRACHADVPHAHCRCTPEAALPVIVREPRRPQEMRLSRVCAANYRHCIGGEGEHPGACV